MYGRNKKISKMNTSRENDAIILEFPEVDSNNNSGWGRSSSLDVKYSHGYKKGDKENHYFSHRSEDTDLEALTKEPSTDAYTNFTPEEMTLQAFSDDEKLRLSPEDIGAMIMLDFGEYVNENLEKCAPIFNGSLAQKNEIKVWLQAGESLNDISVLKYAMNEWEAGVKNETDSKIRDVLHPHFSTSNDVTDMVYSGLLMGAAKEFFEYSFSSMCGIPEIKLEGQKSDWEKLREMVQGLSTVNELSELVPAYEYIDQTVLENIVDLYEGKEDIKFWSSIIKHESMSGSEGASSGWLPSISLYQKKGELLNQKNRWTEHGNNYQCKHLKVPVVNVKLISDNSVGAGNVDPTLSVNIGFTSASTKDDYLKPVLGLDAYAREELTKY